MIGQAARPVAAHERIVYLDVLRGFAVLGILLANMPFMALAGAVVYAGEPYIGGDSWLDRASYAFVYVFADTKFVTLFSLLFGAGLGLMSRKALATGAPFAMRYARRLMVLFLFGALHVVLLWFGDILMIYAGTGFCAMWFRRRQIKTLLWWAGVLLGVAMLLWAGMGLLDPEDFVENHPDEYGRPMSAEQVMVRDREEVRAVLSSGTFAEMAGKRVELYGDAIPFLLAFFAPRTLALFLIGMAFVKSGLLASITELRGLRRVALGGIVCGLVLCAVSLWLEHLDRGVLQMLALFFGGLVLAIGYAATIAIWCRSSFLPGLRARLAAVGRMALTNYIGHSLVTSLIFNWAGWFDRLRRPELLLLTFLIFALQLWLSPLWLRAFRFGPLEWLWRVATYGRALRLRAQTAP